MTEFCCEDINIEVDHHVNYNSLITMKFSSILIFLISCLVLFTSVSYTDGASLQDKRAETLARIKQAIKGQPVKVVADGPRKFSGRDIISKVKQRRHIK